MKRFTAALIMVLALASPAAAACPQTSVADLEDEIMCPVCGTSLATAGDAPLAVQQRRLIDGLVRQCRSKEQIKDTLVAQYGETVLADPEPEGFDLTAWFVPILGIGAGLTIAGVAALRWRRRRARSQAAGAGVAGAAASGGPASDRLDEDMRRYDL
jgi:cytochrome c-type biogenesis protein CcmH/NrfF